MKAFFTILALSVFLSGCFVIFGPAYGWTAYQLDAGYLITISVGGITQYGKYDWREEFEKRARLILEHDFNQKGVEFDQIVFRKLKLSEPPGGPNAIAILGTAEFVAEWNAKDDYSLGYAIYETRNERGEAFSKIGRVERVTRP